MASEYITLSSKAKERIVEALCNEVHLDFITEDTIRAFVSTLALKPGFCEEQLFLMSDEHIALNLSLKFYHFWSSDFLRELGQARRDLDAARQAAVSPRAQAGEARPGSLG